MTATLDPSELLAAEPAMSTGIRIGYARVSTDGQNLDRLSRSLQDLITTVTDLCTAAENTHAMRPPDARAARVFFFAGVRPWR